jgi:hypothetical protein
VENKQLLKNNYLDAMGIQPWFPRVLLVNSLPPLTLTDELSYEKASVPEQSVSAVQSVSEDGKPVQSAVGHSDVSVQSVVNSKSSVALKASDPEQQTKRSENGRPVRFGLGLYVLGDWLVASSLVSDHVLYQDQAIALVSNIIRAIDGVHSPLQHHHIISWPFFTNNHADQGIDAARQYVTGVIDHLKEEHQTQKFLVFGGVLPKLNNWSLSGKINQNSDRLILPSLYKMMDTPELKAQAWKEIKQSPFFLQK